MSNSELISAPTIAWHSLKELVLNAVSADSSKRAYNLALDHFEVWYFRVPRAPFSKAVVQEFKSDLQRDGYSPSTICTHLAAIRRLSIEAADNGFLEPQIAAAVCRIRGPRRLGRRVGNWLTEPQAEDLIKAPGSDTRKGRRDRALLSVMIGCGLRRNEVAGLTMNHLQVREARWIFADLRGKHGRIRSVPIPAWVMETLDAWTQSASITEGFIFRAINKADVVVGDRMSAQAIYEIAKTHGYRRGLRISPHDLRRTYAKVTHANGAPIEQIQYSLGHASITTTELYLGLEQDLKNAPGDRIRIRL